MSIARHFHHYCRNPRCRSKLPEPADNPHAAFCAKGCWSQHHHRRCVVCESEFERTVKAAGRLVCGKSACRGELRKRPEVYRPFHAGPMARVRQKPSEPPGLADRAFAEQEVPVPQALNPYLHGLRGWQWVRLQRADDDWELFARDGRMAARIRQEGDGYWLARPRVTPEPPVESREPAMRRGEQVAMWALPCRMPTQPAGHVDPTPIRSIVDIGDATLSTFTPRLKSVNRAEWDGLDIPKFLARAHAEHALVDQAELA